MTRTLDIATRCWPLKEPFEIARGVQTSCEVIIVQLAEDERVGRGEAVGVDYRGETLATMRKQIEAVRADVEGGANRFDLLRLLPPGGARNALDAALWDLEAKQSNESVWTLAGLGAARPVTTCFTIGIRSLSQYEARARELARYPWLKVKVNAERPIEAIAAVRRGAPNARLVVDANQSWSVQMLREITPALAELRVDLLEQPIPYSDDQELIGYAPPIPICADEPANTVEDLARVAGRYQFVNIKLDKAGGLTAALEMAVAARALGLRLMVGCMMGGSLAMAPAMVLAQLCEVADLDGPLLQAEDWPEGLVYEDGVVQPPSPTLWG
jgi:L-alanine-DL-glutamate epimerase-like enolase superfamily enzyme